MSSELRRGSSEGRFHKPQLSLCRRLALALLACIQNSMIGGLLYGWASIDRTLLAAPRSDGGAALQLRETTVMFSWAASVGMLSTLVLGVIVDMFGPRICSVLSHAFIATGCILFSMAARFELFALGICLISFGGPGIQVSIVHLANLFPHNRFLALSLIGGTISISFAVLALFDWFWETHKTMTYSTLFGMFSIFVIISMLLSFLVWPDEPFEMEHGYETLIDDEVIARSAEQEYIEAYTEHRHLIEQPLESYLREDPKHVLERHRSFVLSKKAMETGESALISLKDQPFYKQLFSGVYLRNLIFFIITSFLANFYVASFSTEMADFQDFPSSKQNDMARIFTFFMAMGVIISLVVGWLMDRVGIDFCNALTLILGISHLVLLLAFHGDYEWMIASFVVYVSFRQFLYPVYISSLTARLGFKYFGLLLGIGFAIAGVVQALMASLVAMVQGDCHTHATKSDDTCGQGSWVLLHQLEIVLLVLLLAFPVYDHWVETRRKRILLLDSFSMQYGSIRSSDASLLFESVRLPPPIGTEFTASF